MAYRYEKESKEVSALVIDGFEQGIADSPYQGIANMRNVGIKYYPGVAYVNYKRLAATISGGTFAKPNWGVTSPQGIIYFLDDTGQVWKQSASGSSTFNQIYNPSFTNNAQGNGLAYWNNYLFVFRKWGIDCIGDGTGDGGITFSNWNAYNTYSFTGTLSAGATSGTLTGAPLGGNGTYTIIFSDGETKSASITSTAVSWSGGLANNVTATVGINEANLDNAGALFTGTLFPIERITTISFTGGISVGDTSATISTYTDANGVSQSGAWLGAGGNWLLVNSNGQSIGVLMTYNSATVTFLQATPFAFGASTSSLYPLVNGTLAQTDPNTGLSNAHMAYVARADSNLYITNGNTIAQLSVPSSITLAGGSFSKRNPTSFVYNYNKIALPTTEISVWISELASQLLIASNFNLNPWTVASVGTGLTVQNPIPIVEQIFKVVNILNNIYILAGYKGNIYLSNGYSIFPFKKIPDYVANSAGSGNLSPTSAIDPQWVWGGVMTHRQRLWFQATAINSQTGANIMSGIFSLTINNPVMVTGLETTGALTIEAQNSFGLNASTTNPKGVLIDYKLNSQYDLYFSAWSSGVGDVGGIDYNSTTLWSSAEPTIETDLIETGTFLTPETFSNMEFKLDQPMKSGDSITVYARQSLSDTYVLVGTTAGSTLQLSDKYQQNFSQSQWLQFMITLTCNPTATSSSFMRLRKILLR